MNHQSFFSAVRAKKLARRAPEMLCHTENTAKELFEVLIICYIQKVPIIETGTL